MVLKERGENMLKKVSVKTAEFIKEKVIDVGISKFPITNESICDIFDWFEQEEISLANAENDGECVDKIYFDSICKAVDELMETGDIVVDLEHLNDVISKM